MTERTAPTPNLSDILVRLLVIATRILRDVNIHASTTKILKTLLAATEAATRVSRAIRLLTLLLRRIESNGLGPIPRTRPTPGGNPRRARPERKPEPFRFHPGNADADFVRRPLHVVIAAINRELHLAARILGAPLPEEIQALCLQAALLATPHDIPEPTNATPTQPTPNPPAPCTQHPAQTTPPPITTLEL